MGHCDRRISALRAVRFRHYPRIMRAPARLLATASLSFPLLLRLFHASVTAEPSVLVHLAGLLSLVIAMAVPLAGVAALAHNPVDLSAPSTRTRATALLAIATPPAFVLVGVLQALVRSEIPDELMWPFVWTVAFWALVPSAAVASQDGIPDASAATMRIAHGTAGALAACYLLFHLVNHAMGLAGPAAHARLMEVGRAYYRSAVLEPLLVAVMLFQVVTGVAAARNIMRRPVGTARAIQVATGTYLAVFILAHMNSVFVYARLTLGIDTGWNFATGAPSGLLMDVWNIRLVPHYWWGVTCAVVHLASGARVVALAHGIDRGIADAVWAGAGILSMLFATAIIAGMIGVRI